VLSRKIWLNNSSSVVEVKVFFCLSGTGRKGSLR